MSTTLLVEPNHTGHRFSYVRYLIDHGSLEHVTLLTSVGATDRPEFQFELGGEELAVIERFSGIQPAGREIVEAIAEVCRVESVDQVVVMDADHPLKTWWWHALRAFRRLPNRPRISFLYTRYPLRFPLREPAIVVRGTGMALLTVLALATRTLSHAVALTSRDDRKPGRLIQRVADPAVCGAHARHRDRLRAEHGLPANRSLVGVFGRVGPDKNVPLVAAAAWSIGPEVDLVLAGPMSAEVAAWMDGLDDEHLRRVIVREGFLEQQVMDELLASCDVIAVAMDYDRPSAVMGKALAACVPVLSAGSRVRARELTVTGGGIASALDRDSIADAISTLLDRGPADDSGLAEQVASPRTLALALLDHAGS